MSQVLGPIYIGLVRYCGVEEVDTLAKLVASLPDMQGSKFSAASALAFKRRQTKQLLLVLKRAQEGAEEAEVVQSLVADLSEGDLKYALQTLRDWNTKAGSAQQAQTLLNALISYHSPEVHHSRFWSTFEPSANF